jgi:hypothetical protein
MSEANVAGMLRPAHAAAAVTPDDNTTVDFRALYIGVAGTVVVDVRGGGTSISFANAQGILPISVSKVYSTGTTATGIIGLI